MTVVGRASLVHLTSRESEGPGHSGCHMACATGGLSFDFELFAGQNLPFEHDRSPVNGQSSESA